jgi:plastocyanin
MEAMRKGTLSLAFVLGIAAAACGGGGGGGDGSSGTPQPSSTPGGPPANCTDESSGNVFTLAQKNTAFHPDCVIVRSEQSIHITNEDGVTHNFSITGTQVNVDIAAGKFFNGESAGLKPGTYQFFCRFHKSVGMVGTIVVK